MLQYNNAAIQLLYSVITGLFIKLVMFEFICKFVFSVEKFE